MEKNLNENKHFLVSVITALTLFLVPLILYCVFILYVGGVDDSPALRKHMSIRRLFVLVSILATSYGFIYTLGKFFPANRIATFFGFRPVLYFMLMTVLAILYFVAGTFNLFNILH
jgi:hypothetical protein